MQTAPQFSYPGLEDQALVYEALGLVYHKFSNMARIVDTGNAFLILEVENENVLKNLVRNQPLIAKICTRYGLQGFYIFSLPNFAPGIDATTRMFAPGYGINEETEAGTAAGSLACYLYRFVNKKTRYRIEEGKFIRHTDPVLIDVNLILDNNKILGLYTGENTEAVKQLMIETV